MTIETEKLAKNITLDDVRNALLKNEIDARDTNSGAVRKLIGDRGSFATIQKFLEVLRVELEPKAVELAGAIPATPKDLVDLVWQAAWTASQASTTGSLATALLERDAARASLAAANADLDASNVDGDAALSIASEASAKAVSAEAAELAAKEALEAFKAAAAASALASENKLAQVLASADSSASSLTAAHKLEISHAQTKIATLEGIIERMNEQLAEVKSLLPRRPEQVKNEPAKK